MGTVVVTILSFVLCCGVLWCAVLYCAVLMDVQFIPILILTR